MCFAEALEAADGLVEIDEVAGGAGEHRGDGERLREEALDLAGAGDDELVLLAELVHSQDGDDVLQVLVLLEGGLDLAGHVVVALADDVGVEERVVESSGSTAG